MKTFIRYNKSTENTKNEFTVNEVQATIKFLRAGEASVTEGIIQVSFVILSLK